MSYNDGSPIPIGKHWGTYSATTELPNASSGVHTAALRPGDVAAVNGELYVCSAIAGSGAATWSQLERAGGASSFSDIDASGDITATGDLDAGGGFRMAIGPFTAPGAAGVTAADQTALDLRYSHTVAAVATSFVATRAGSIVGLSGHIDEAVAGADQSITVQVTINGTELVDGPELAFTEAGSETELFASAAKDAHPFDAGDLIGVSYTSDTITSTPILVCSVIIEQ